MQIDQRKANSSDNEKKDKKPNAKQNSIIDKYFLLQLAI